MFNIPTVSGLAVAFLLIASVPNAESYTKYGRTCKDIGCKSDEVCVLAEDPCSFYQRDNCGSYPTCRKANGGPSCTSMVCGENEYCKTENGAPKCVRRTTGNVMTTRAPSRYPARATPPTPPPRSSSFGGRYNGISGSRNTIGSGSLYSRLFGDDRNRGSRVQVTTPRPRTQYRNSGYYQSHTTVDANGNRVWTFSG